MTEQREHTPGRHTADTINDNDLDQLYARIAWLEQALATVANCFHESADDLEDALRLSRRSGRARASTIVQARRWAARAKQAEAAITRVRETAEGWERMPSYRHVYIHEAARTIRAALDEPKES